MRIDATTPPRASAPGAIPRRAEVWLVAAALLATMMLIPLLGKYSDDSHDFTPAAETFWCILYLVAGIRLSAMWTLARGLLTRSVPLLVFVALMLVSILWSVDPTRTFKNAIELIGTTVIAYYIVARFTLVELLEILALAFGAAGVLSLALIFAAPGHGRTDWGTGAWSGIFQEKNALGAAVALAGLSLLALLGTRTGRVRILIFGLLVLMVTLLIGSASATAVTGYSAATLAILVLWACRSKRFGVAARILSVCVPTIAALAYFVVGVTPDSILALLGREPNLTGRTEFWPYLQQAIAERPILGYGYDAFFGSEEGKGYLSYLVVEMGGWSPYHAHNSFLQICLNSGFVGAASFGWMLAGGFWRGLAYAWREPSRAAVWPFAVLLYLVVGSFTETYFPSYNTIEWVVLVAAVLYPLREAAQREKPDRTVTEASARGKTAW